MRSNPVGKRALFVTLYMAILCSALLWGCAPTIASFSPAAYDQAVSIKVETLSLMNKAGDSCHVHQQEVEALTLHIQLAYEYAKGRPKNELSAKQWEILMDPNEGPLGEFLQRWNKEPISSAAYLSAKKVQIGRAFDAIIGLESGKLKPADLQQR
jgi:hypothetical protein